MWERCRVTFDTCWCESVLMAQCKEGFGFISVGEMHAAGCLVFFTSLISLAVGMLWCV